MIEKDILDLIRSDPWRMTVLRAAESMHLPDWLIGSGFVRNKVWDHLHGRLTSEPPADIDLVFFDASLAIDAKDVERKLKIMMPGLEWEVVNQVDIHDVNEEQPYTSTEDAISKWPETATAIGVRLEGDTLSLVAPHGIEDLVNLVVRPTPAFTSDRKRVRVIERMTKKKWMEKWPKLRTEDL